MLSQAGRVQCHSVRCYLMADWCVEVLGLMFTLHDRKWIAGELRFKGLIREAAYRKRTGLIFPDQSVDNAWQHKRTSRWRWEPWEELSFLHFLTLCAFTVESG